MAPPTAPPEDTATAELTEEATAVATAIAMLVATTLPTAAEIPVAASAAASTETYCRELTHAESSPAATFVYPSEHSHKTALSDPVLFVVCLAGHARHSELSSSTLKVSMAQATHELFENIWPAPHVAVIFATLYPPRATRSLREEEEVRKSSSKRLVFSIRETNKSRSWNRVTSMLA